MKYDFAKALSNLHNVVVVLNEGGMVSCRDIADRLWSVSPGWKQGDKIASAKLPRNRNELYAITQLRQEVRRSLNDYFSSDSEFFINRATALNDSERFWVEDTQIDFSLPLGYDDEEDDYSEEEAAQAILSELLLAASSRCLN